MPHYLSYQFTDSEDFIETFDEAPLWSATFGLFLLKHIQLKPDETIVDLGCGAGFPLLELAGRLGNSCKLIGIDPWKNAVNRARKKIHNYQLENVQIIESSGDKIPLENESVHAIVSNLGINNFENRTAVFQEAYRVLKTGGRLSLTTNLNGHWKEFYGIVAQTLKETGNERYLPQLQEHETHRGSVQTVSDLFTNAGFTVSRFHTDEFQMRFLNGSAFLNHYFIKLGWLDSWKKLFPDNNQQDIFSAIENKLNLAAAEKGELSLSVPMLFIEGIK